MIRSAFAPVFTALPSARRRKASLWAVICLLALSRLIGTQWNQCGQYGYHCINGQVMTSIRGGDGEILPAYDSLDGIITCEPNQSCLEPGALVCPASDQQRTPAERQPLVCGQSEPSCEEQLVRILTDEVTWEPPSRDRTSVSKMSSMFHRLDIENDRSSSSSGQSTPNGPDLPTSVAGPSALSQKMDMISTSPIKPTAAKQLDSTGVYDKRFLLALSKSPLIKRPEALRDLKEWYGDYDPPPIRMSIPGSGRDHYGPGQTEKGSYSRSPNVQQHATSPPHQRNGPGRYDGMRQGESARAGNRGADGRLAKANPFNGFGRFGEDEEPGAMRARRTRDKEAGKPSSSAPSEQDRSNAAGAAQPFAARRDGRAAEAGWRTDRPAARTGPSDRHVGLSDERKMRQEAGRERDRDRHAQRDERSRERGFGRPAWADDTTRDDGQSSSAPGWSMDSSAAWDAPSDSLDDGLGGKAGGSGQLDSIQAWKAEMKELERKKAGLPPSEPERPLEPPASFKVPTAEAAPPAKQSMLSPDYLARAPPTATEADSSAPPRSSRFARFFGDEKKAAQAKASSDLSPGLSEAPTSRPQPPANSADQESMQRLMSMLSMPAQPRPPQEANRQQQQQQQQPALPPGFEFRQVHDAQPQQAPRVQLGFEGQQQTQANLPNLLALLGQPQHQHAGQQQQLSDHTQARQRQQHSHASTSPLPPHLAGVMPHHAPSPHHAPLPHHAASAGQSPMFARGPPGYNGNSSNVSKGQPYLSPENVLASLPPQLRDDPRILQNPALAARLAQQHQSQHQQQNQHYGIPNLQNVPVNTILQNGPMASASPLTGMPPGMNIPGLNQMPTQMLAAMQQQQIYQQQEQQAFRERQKQQMHHQQKQQQDFDAFQQTHHRQPSQPQPAANLNGFDLMALLNASRGTPGGLPPPAQQGKSFMTLEELEAHSRR
ncbi:uncharacterized protein L969DRAFT_73400 [Mixia osmundae IAM 14324]|uniref:Uncharacterized protein n=1 Tax=Mixia osmundae (strain CBS 9802 / IAM 14324 / JCM 22182 / KY 12970) TaxID=764103 RepID=G7E9V9_MIXOS|nr:uncharacterized protein L969DRAFT_73400 [Mixia osmundae IAM 14324]KEI40060.1 hypothetical protein L969DRAFT_73400 [Mixia osmundae IAM 14324]GAA99428.1 hypothetical protein E5Q_06126 [Mixia osmundae IAM 14324]